MRDGGVFGVRGAGELTGATAEAENYDRLVDSPGDDGQAVAKQLYAGWRAYHVVVDSPDRRSGRAAGDAAQDHGQQPWTGCRTVRSTTTRSCFWPPRCRAAEAWSMRIPP